MALDKLVLFFMKA